MTDLVRFDMMMPPELKNRLVAFVANHPHFETNSEVVNLAIREFLDRMRIEEEIFGRYDRGDLNGKMDF